MTDVVAVKNEPSALRRLETQLHATKGIARASRGELTELGPRSTR